MPTKMKLMSLNGNSELSKRIAEYMGMPLLDCTISHFSDGEISINLNESVRGCNVYLLDSVAEPVNTNWMELLIAIDCLKRASANSVAAVLPYFSYTRADRKSRSREPITAKLFANLIEMTEIDRVITMDMHAEQIQGFFDMPVDHLKAMPLFERYFHDKEANSDVVVVAPSHSSSKRARELAEVFDSQIAIIDQRKDSKTNVPDIVGNVEGKVCIIMDDLIDTGTRLINTARALNVAGASTIYAAATHAIFSGDAAKRLNDSIIEEIVVTDSVVVDDDKDFDKLVKLSVAPMFGDAINSIEKCESTHYLFTMRDDVDIVE
ncbi:ribose-phosphate pyrophosphokinase 2 [Companilactobacillus sp. RD055328]|uniref:ribose-phosphate diphosphokinase n=1 Tax=Companilactobacillus sp. RD055328 TaxID=2916634 RepID=UPI001FC8ACE2|nr:ribose-phosphate diphosphokinase [Companilactobacillus sp. RD055328]GKQ43247.1 ribose-phosphate pyrophosphokinase 2 [Companilactobacillus sp. RD055328]